MAVTLRTDDAKGLRKAQQYRAERIKPVLDRVREPYHEELRSIPLMTTTALSGDAAGACLTCAGASCQTCPEGKNPHEINLQLQDINFDDITIPNKIYNDAEARAQLTGNDKAISDLWAYIEEYHADFTPSDELIELIKAPNKDLDHYRQVRDRDFAKFEERRMGYLVGLQEKIEALPRSSQIELEKLHHTYKLQTKSHTHEEITSPYTEITGYACTAECEGGGAVEDGTGCVEGAGDREPVGIKSIELTLSLLGNAFGWMDEMFTKSTELDTGVEYIIAGNGPAGAKAAVLAAQDGHKVTAYEVAHNALGRIVGEEIPHDHIEKQALGKYMYYQHLAGVDLVLGTAATPENMKVGQQNNPNIRRIIAVGNGDAPNEPRPKSFAKIRDMDDVGPTTELLREVNGKVSEAYESGQKMQVSNEEVIHLQMGLGYTGIDGGWVWTVDSEYLESFGSKSQVILTDRNPAIGDGGTGPWGQPSESGANNARLQAFKEAGHLIIKGANEREFAAEGKHGKTVIFDMVKPKSGYAEAKKGDRYGNYEPDLECGSIRNADGKIIGIRQRGVDNVLQDHRLLENGQYSNEPEKSALKGTTDGTMVIEPQGVRYAYGFAQQPVKNPLVKELDLVEGEGRDANIELIHGRTAKIENTYMPLDGGSLVQSFQNGAEAYYQSERDRLDQEKNQTPWQDMKSAFSNLTKGYVDAAKRTMGRPVEPEKAAEIFA